MKRSVIFGLLISVMFVTAASASVFDGWTVDEIKAHEDFTISDYSLSWATNSGDPDAPHIYEWIGYIPAGDTRVYFTSFGEPLTCVEWQESGEWVPKWVVEALNKLIAKGLIRLDIDGTKH